MEKYEFRILIKHYFLRKKTTKEAKLKLDKYYGDSAPSYSTVKNWFADFKRGRISTDDAERSGRPIEVIVPENIQRIHEEIMNDRKIKIRELSNLAKISVNSVWKIIHDELEMKKLVAKWVPRTLTIDQKQQRVNDSKLCLSVFNGNPNEFLRRYITVDETWIHHYTPESSQQSKQWVGPGESAPHRPKSQQSAGKVMATVFWDAHGILFIDFLEKGKTITGEYYAALLDQLSNIIVEKRPHLAKKKVLVHHDNAPPHRSVISAAKIYQLRYELLPHPSYSPDLAPSDFFLFPNFKRWLSGKRFNTNGEVIAETTAYFEGLEKSYFSEGIKKLEGRWNRCILLKGDYVE